MTYEEFIARAQEVQVLDRDLWRQLRGLYVDKGTVQQLVRAIMDQESMLKESLANNHMVTEDSIRMAIGLQGQVLGIKNVLALIHELMQEPPEEAENAQV